MTTAHILLLLLLPPPYCSWNITECSRLGIKSIYCPRGLTSAAWQEGLALFEAGAPAAEAKKAKPKQSKKVTSKAGV